MQPVTSRSERKVFQHALLELNAAGIEYVVGGAYALYLYTGIERPTKDLDVFLERAQVDAALARLKAVGFDVRIEADYWLAKAIRGGVLVDLIFGSGNWLAPVDRAWIERGRPGTLFDAPVRVASPEDLIWSKAYVAGRERYDAADIAHIILYTPDPIDWRHLLDRFGDDRDLLFSLVVLFRFAFPSEADRIPDWLIAELTDATRADVHRPPPLGRVCRGTLLDRYSYIHDVQRRGYLDPREDLAEERGFDRKAVIRERRRAQRLIQGQ